MFGSMAWVGGSASSVLRQTRRVVEGFIITCVVNRSSARFLAHSRDRGTRGAESAPLGGGGGLASRPVLYLCIYNVI